MLTQNESDYAKDWLNRMIDKARLIESLEGKRDEVIASLSGIGKYDAEHIPAQTGENATETKNLIYSKLSAEIEKTLTELIKEDARTLDAILMVEDSRYKSILIDRYLSRLPWKNIARKQNYSVSWIYKLHDNAIEKVYPFIPKGEVV